MKNLLIALTLVVGIAHGQTTIRAVDASGNSHVVMKFWVDSSWILVPLRLDTQATMPSRGGYIARNGNGDTIYITFGTSGTVAKLSFNGQANGKLFGDSAGVWGPVSSILDSVRAASTGHTKYHWGKIFGTYGTGYSNADSVVIIRPSLAVTVDSIMVWHNTGTATVNVTRTRGATTVDMLSTNATATTTWTAASGLQNATLQAGDVLVATIRSLTTTQQVVIQVDSHQ